VVGGLVECTCRDEARDLAFKLNVKCAAVRSALETHIRAEETELWPLFIEHFTVEEQQRIVGLVIGRTGASVLQEMLSWVSNYCRDNEKEGMMKSLHEATKNTSFDKWMENWNSISASARASDSAPESMSEVFEYLQQNGSSIGEFRPSFDDMFRMNQSQLEAAVLRVSSDESLEPDRKSYLIQRIMASKYITEHQARTSQSSESFPKSFHSIEDQILGCVHYQRNCALVAPCCDRTFVCRLCHDAETDHKLDRYSVQEVVCMACGIRQGVSKQCTNCGIVMAKYFCEICRLYDNSSDKKIYHCPFCNICRLGKGLGEQNTQ